MDPNEMSQQFPSNAAVKKNETPTPTEQPQKYTNVIQPIELRKKSWLERAKDAIFVGDSDSIVGYVVKDVIVPTIRDTVYNAFTEALSMALYSNPKALPAKNRRINSGSTYVSYNRYYDPSPAAVSPINPNVTRPINLNKSSLDVRNIPLPNASIGHEAKEQLSERMQVYANRGEPGFASVQDLFDILSSLGYPISSAPATVAKLGWYDISTANVVFERGQWILKMPKVTQL